MVDTGNIQGPPGSRHQDRVRHVRHVLGGTFIGDTEREGAGGGRGSLPMVVEAPHLGGRMGGGRGE